MDARQAKNDNERITIMDDGNQDGMGAIVWVIGALGVAALALFAWAGMRVLRWL